MPSHEGQEVLLGKHGGLGRTSRAARVTEGKALVWCYFEGLMIDDIV